MRTRPLGSTGVDVSALCLGAMYFGSRNDEAASYRMLDQYLDAGGTFIDTANIYAHWVPGNKGGESERLLGKWMAERKNRAELFIATKVGFGYPGVEQGLRAAQIEAEVEKSLKRLGIETIDLYYAHNDDRGTPLEETLEAFYRLVKAGKVRYLGASNFVDWRLEKARWISRTHDWPEYVCIQQRYSYLRPKPGADFSPQVAANDELLAYCKSEKVTLIAYSVLLSGAYTREERHFPEQYLGADTNARLKTLHEISQELEVTPNQVILAWMLQRDIIPLIAASTTDQMVENLGALDIELSSNQMQRLSEAGA